MFSLRAAFGLGLGIFFLSPTARAVRPFVTNDAHTVGGPHLNWRRIGAEEPFDDRALGTPRNWSSRLARADYGGQSRERNITEPAARSMPSAARSLRRRCFCMRASQIARPQSRRS